MDTLIFGALVVVGIVGVLWLADRASRRKAEDTIEEAPDLLENPGVDLVLERIRQERPGPVL
jgi:hypothetical protein